MPELPCVNCAARSRRRFGWSHLRPNTEITSFPIDIAVQRFAVAIGAHGAQIRLPAQDGAAPAEMPNYVRIWYTSRQPTPVLWPLPQSEHKAFFDAAPMEDFEFTRTGPAAPGD